VSDRTEPAGAAKSDKALASRRIVVAAIIGLLAGFLAGMFGVGGGILIVPALVLVLGVKQRLAHGTSLAAIIPIAVVGVVGYAAAGSVDWVAAVILAAGSALGAIAGTHGLQRLPQRALRLAFSVFLIANAISLFLTLGSSGPQKGLSVATGLGLLLIGLVAGTIAGLLGVGGGVVVVPALVVLISMGVAKAKGTSLAVIVPTAVVGTLRNLRAGNVDLVLAAVVGITGMASTYVGTKLAMEMSPRLSKTLFACLLIAIVAISFVGARSSKDVVSEVGPTAS